MPGEFPQATQVFVVVFVKYIPVVWDPHQLKKKLSKSPEAVKHYSARQIFQDFKLQTSASALMSKLTLRL